MDKPQLWKENIAKSVDHYNNWFFRFAPKTYLSSRKKTKKEVEKSLKLTNNLLNISHDIMKLNPQILPTLRMITAPPLAQDRLVGLANVSKNLVLQMEQEGRIPIRMSPEKASLELKKIGNVLTKLVDKDLLVWLETKRVPTKREKDRAALIIADRLCGTVSDPIIRNAQEKRQLLAIKKWLKARGYTEISKLRPSFDKMKSGTFTFRLTVNGKKEDGSNIAIPIDAVVMPKHTKKKTFPVLIEAKSAGDFTNVNKRRKEEATKFIQLKKAHGSRFKFILFLCGYFDSGYLGYEAAEGIDWVWEHKINDLSKFGL